MEKRLIEVIYTVCKNHELSLTETFTITGDECMGQNQRAFKSTELDFRNEFNRTRSRTKINDRCFQEN